MRTAVSGSKYIELRIPGFPFSRIMFLPWPEVAFAAPTGAAAMPAGAVAAEAPVAF